MMFMENIEILVWQFHLELFVNSKNVFKTQHLKFFQVFITNHQIYEEKRFLREKYWMKSESYCAFVELR